MDNFRCCSTPICGWLKSLFRRKPMYTIENVLQTPLKRCLHLHHVVFYGLAYMLGAGVLSGDLIARVTGGAACISYFLAGIVNLFTALCYMELASLIPRAGSVYVYTFLILGELPAFIIGWFLFSSVLCAISSIAQSFSETINVMLHGAITNWTIEYVGRLPTSPDSVIAPTYDFPAATLIIVLTVIVATGAKSSMSVNAVFSSITVLCLAICSGACFVLGSMKSFSPENGGFAPEGFSGIIEGAAIATVSYIGYETVARASEEMVNPVKDIPRAIIIVLVCGMVLYFTDTFALAYLEPRQLINVKSPYVAAFESRGITWLVVISSIGTMLAFGASKVSSIYIIPRTLYAIGDDGLIFKCFARVEKRTQVPQISLWFGASMAALLALIFKFQFLLDFCSVGYLLAFITIGVDLMVLRYIMKKDESVDHVEVMKSQERACGNGDSMLNVDEKSNKDKIDCSVMTIRNNCLWIVKRFPFFKYRCFFYWLISAYVGVAFVLAMVIDYALFLHSLLTPIGVTVVLLWAIIFGALSVYRPSYSDRSYQSPLMPMAPLFAILTNAILILRLSALTWLRFFVWLAIGLVIYFGYGRRHSIARETADECTELTGSKFSEQESPTLYGSDDKK